MSAVLRVSTPAEAAEIRFRHAWIADDRESVHAAVYISHACLILESPAEADALIAAVAEAKAELIRLEAERTTPPMAPEPSAGCDGAHPDGEWLCTAIAGHEPDGEIVARWPVVPAEGGETGA